MQAWKAPVWLIFFGIFEVIFKAQVKIYSNVLPYDNSKVSWFGVYMHAVSQKQLAQSSNPLLIHFACHAERTGAYWHKIRNIQFYLAYSRNYRYRQMSLVCLIALKAKIKKRKTPSAFTITSIPLICAFKKPISRGKHSLGNFEKDCMSTSFCRL